MALEEAGVDCDLTVIEDSSEALTFIGKQGQYSDRVAPDLIAMDLHLYGVSGDEVLGVMKVNRDFASVPIILVSSELSRL